MLLEQNCPLKLINGNFNNLLAQLTNIGLTKYEALIYLAAATNGESSAKHVSEITSIPYGKVYEVINSLTKKGFLNNITTKPLKFHAIAPKEALANVKSKMNEKLAEAEKTIVEELAPLLKEKNKEKTISIIEGEENIYRKILELCKNNSGLSIFGCTLILKKILSKINIASKKKSRLIVFYNKENAKEVSVLKKNTKEFLNCKFKLVDFASTPCILLNDKEGLIIEEFKNHPYYIEPAKAMYFSNTSLVNFLNFLFKTSKLK